MQDPPSDSDRIFGHVPGKLYEVAANGCPDSTNSCLNLEPPPAPESLADSFPGFVPEQLLGRGAMGAVYLAQQKSLKRKVGIKVILRDLTSNPEIEARFEGESNALASLNHPHIVQVFEAGISHDGFPFLVMEYMAAGNLRERMVAQSLSMEEVSRLFLQACSALEHAHSHGILHRDIKPENILLDPSGNAKIGDFGLAKRVAQKQFGLTDSGQILGTMHYYAPEQADPIRKVDQRCDVFSLGVLLYEMITGSVPRGSYPPPSRFLPHPSPKLDQVVCQAMASNPEERYSGVGELMEDFKTVDLAHPIRSPLSRHSRRTLITAGIVGVGTLTSIPFVLPKNSQVETSLPLQERRGRLRIIAKGKHMNRVPNPGEGDEFIAVKVGSRGWTAMRPDRTLVYGWVANHPPPEMAEEQFRSFAPLPAALAQNGNLHVWEAEYEERIDTWKGIRLFSVAHRYAAAILADGGVRIWSVNFEDSPRVFQPPPSFDGRACRKLVASNIGICFLQDDGSVYVCDRNERLRGSFENERFHDVEPLTNGFLGLTIDREVVDFGRDSRLKRPKQIQGASRIAAGKRIAAAQVDGKWFSWTDYDESEEAQQIVSAVNALESIDQLSINADIDRAIVAWIEPS